MTKKNNKMKMVKDPKTGKMVPEFAVKKAEGKTVKKKMKVLDSVVHVWKQIEF